MQTEIITAVLSGLVIASYLFSVLSRWTRIPSVLLLLTLTLSVGEELFWKLEIPC